LIEDLGNSLLESKVPIGGEGIPLYDAECRLGNYLAVLETGSRPRGGVSVDTVGVVSLGAESIQSAGVTPTIEFKKVPQDFAARMRRGRLEDEDLLVYKDGGRPGNFIPHVSAFGHGFPVSEAAINEHVYRVRAGGGYSQALLYWLLRSPWMDQEMRKRGTGVAIPSLNSANFRDLPVPVIAPSDVHLLNAQLSPLLTLLLRLGAQNRQLAQMRDTLLPELISGRIRIPEAVEAIA
jgi:type I restriction enzyme S subunit